MIRQMLQTPSRVEQHVRPSTEQNRVSRHALWEVRLGMAGTGR